MGLDMESESHFILVQLFEQVECAAPVDAALDKAEQLGAQHYEGKQRRGKWKTHGMPGNGAMETGRG